MIEALRRHSRPILLSGLGLAALAILVRLFWPGAGTIFEVALLVGTGLGLVGAAGILLPVGDVPDAPVREVHPPVTGRWLALNSPATRVPSHGTRGYGQSHAIDLVYDPLPEEGHGTRPEFGAGPGMRPAEDYPAFGQPVLAMVTGTVVRVTDGTRDHRSRTKIWSVAYLFAEAAFRDLAGPSAVLGNHVVIDAGDGSFALVAHLVKGSVAVRVGDRVEAGQQIGRCGNSGNSTEPHVHAHLMDRPDATAARGLPLRFTGIRVDDGPPTAGVPENGKHLTTT
ncbi:M23 family metallopeptidase [Micromonospora sp. NPDC000207]|uniref:M23 family metallopeptidase n=1 Tax=Micromonospora sp. NPDC000207 TaxID=3154246 RepID=UPI00332B264F